MNPGQHLRRAVEAGDLVHARELVASYAAWLASRLAELPPESREARRLAQECHALFGWTRATVLCARAQCAAQWEEAGRLQGYLAAPSARRTWEMRG